jgi:ribose transport system permease protein
MSTPTRDVERIERSTPAPTTSAARARALANTVLARYGLVLVFIVIVVVFSILMPETYFSLTNLSAVGNGQIVTLILAMAVLSPLIVGEFDLSVAQLFGSLQLLVIGLMSRDHVGILPAVILTMVGGLLVGGINALLIVKFKVSSFIATLGVSTVLQGLGLWYSGGQVIFAGVPASFLRIAQRSLFGVPLPAWYGAVVALALWFLYAYTAVGRRMFATGGNRAAATLSGINNGRLVTVALVIAGGLAAIAAIIIASQLGSGQPLLGPSYLLPAYAGAFLGATTVTPGRFNVLGTVIAVYLLAAGVTGLQQLGVPSWVEPVFNGLALVIAVAFSGYVARTRARRRLQADNAETP